MIKKVCVNFFKPVTMFRSYKQEGGFLAHFVHMATTVTTLLKDEESARDKHVLACNFSKYSPF